MVVIRRNPIVAQNEISLADSKQEHASNSRTVLTPRILLSRADVMVGLPLWAQLPKNLQKEEVAEHFHPSQ